MRYLFRNMQRGQIMVYVAEEYKICLLIIIIIIIDLKCYNNKSFEVIDFQIMTLRTYLENRHVKSYE